MHMHMRTCIHMTSTCRCLANISCAAFTVSDQVIADVLVEEANTALMDKGITPCWLTATTAEGRRLQSQECEECRALTLAITTSSTSNPSVPMSAVLGYTDSPGWALLLVRAYHVHTSHDAFDYADVYATLQLKSAGARVLHFKSDAQENLNRGDLALAILIPMTGIEMEVSLWDNDSPYTSDDKIGKATLPLSSAECQLSTLGDGVCTKVLRMESWHGWWWSRYQRLDATVSVSVHGGTARDGQLSALHAQGTSPTEANTPILDGTSAHSYWNRIQYYSGQVGYLLSGLFSDSDKVPVTGILDYRYQGISADQQTANGPGEDTTSLIGWEVNVAHMSNLGAKLASHDRYRRNELGLQFFNGKLWPEKNLHTIALGDEPIDHGRSRPFLDWMVGCALARIQTVALTVALCSRVQRWLEEVARAWVGSWWVAVRRTY